MSDAASLQILHDVVLPAPIAGWPPAPGWYLVAAIAAGFLLWLAWRGWQWWRRNRYRGQALRELERIRRGVGDADLSELPALLKRSALSAWPREQVAELTGRDWHLFLDHSAGMDRFCSGIGASLDRLAYPSAAADRIAAEEAEALVDAARTWLRQHRVTPEEG